MIINLDATEGELFPFQVSTINPETGETTWEAPDAEAYVVVRSMQPFFEERMLKRKKVVEHVYNPKSRQMERDRHDADLTPEEARKENEDAFDYAIIELGKFTDSKTGKPIETTRENKLKLLKIPVFDRFITKCFRELANAGAKAREEQDLN
jgi:hypothetical protein